MPGAFFSQPEKPTLDFLRKKHAEGRIKGLGEITTQYYGHRPDPNLDPYFSLAEELDIPAHIHTAGIGAPLPIFRASAGNPLFLEEVLVGYPKLRLYAENCGFPYTQEWMTLAYEYPQVYCEVSTATWIVNYNAF